MMLIGGVPSAAHLHVVLRVHKQQQRRGKMSGEPRRMGENENDGRLHRRGVKVGRAMNEA